MILFIIKKFPKYKFRYSIYNRRINLQKNIKNYEIFKKYRIFKNVYKNSHLIENVNYHKTHIKNLGKVFLPDPEFGDFKLSVMPFENNGSWVSLPEGFKKWEKSFNDILKHIPLQDGANTHYVTIDTKFFTTDEFLRREGVHIDGNFCVDPKFRKLNENKVSGESSNEFKASWGGAEPKPSWGGVRINDEESVPGEFKASWGGAEPKPSWGGVRINDEELVPGESSNEFKASWGGAEPKPSWGGAMAGSGSYDVKEDNSHVKMDWVLPYKIVIPISDYVSENKGGIITVSTEPGCQAWHGEFYGEIMGEGSFEKMENQLTDNKKVIFEKNQLYFMSSNTPHETLLIKKGKRRTFLRITLNHNYENSVILK